MVAPNRRTSGVSYPAGCIPRPLAKNRKGKVRCSEAYPLEIHRGSTGSIKTGFAVPIGFPALAPSRVDGQRDWVQFLRRDQVVLRKIRACGEVLRARRRKHEANLCIRRIQIFRRLSSHAGRTCSALSGATFGIPGAPLITACTSSHAISAISACALGVPCTSTA